MIYLAAHLEAQEGTCTRTRLKQKAGTKTYTGTVLCARI